MPPISANVTVRFADGAPSLETLINGVPADIGAAYLQVNGKTVASSFDYGTLTPFVTLPAGHALAQGARHAGLLRRAAQDAGADGR